MATTAHTQENIQIIMKAISNQRQHDKFSLCYMLANSIKYSHCLLDVYKRAELIEMFRNELTTNERFFNKVASFNTISQLFNK